MKEGKTCKICAKTFTRRNYLQKHMENIHSKRYSCPTCLRYFAGPTDHSCATKDGRFTCYVDKCSLKFANGMSLRLHIRDGHRKVDENITNASAMKTKKAARDMVKMLCRKINVLSKCFDELKYQMDNVTDFLKTIGYALPPNEEPKRTIKNKTLGTNLEDMEDFMDFIEEELIEEVSQTDDEIIADNDLFSKPKNLEIGNNQIIRVYSNIQNLPPEPLLSETSAETVKENMSTIALPTVIDQPYGARGGSTIIRQVPVKIVPIQQSESNKPIIFESATGDAQVQATTSAVVQEKDTPPLFLKIQYDTEAEVCKTDPKITFHFDTRPLDITEDDLTIPT